MLNVVHKAFGGFEDASDLLVCHAHVVESAEKADAHKVVAMNLGSRELMPAFHRLKGYWTVYPGGLVQSEATMIGE